jgi:hypothetical protein
MTSLYENVGKLRRTWQTRNCLRDGTISNKSSESVCVRQTARERERDREKERESHVVVAPQKPVFCLQGRNTNYVPVRTVAF